MAHPPQRMPPVVSLPRVAREEDLPPRAAPRLATDATMPDTYEPLPGAPTEAPDAGPVEAPAGPPDWIVQLLAASSAMMGGGKMPRSAVLETLGPAVLAAGVDYLRALENRRQVDVVREDAEDEAKRAADGVRERARRDDRYAHAMAHERRSAVLNRHDLAANLVHAAVGMGMPIRDVDAKFVALCWERAGLLSALKLEAMAPAVLDLVETVPPEDDVCDD